MCYRPRDIKFLRKESDLERYKRLKVVPTRLRLDEEYEKHDSLNITLT